MNGEHLMNHLCIGLIINWTFMYVSYVTIRTIFQHISTRFNLKDSPLSICWLHINNQVKRHFDRIPTPPYSEDQLGSVVNNHGDRKSPNWRCTNSFRWPNTMASKWGWSYPLTNWDDPPSSQKSGIKTQNPSFGTRHTKKKRHQRFMSKATWKIQGILMLQNPNFVTMTREIPQIPPSRGNTPQRWKRLRGTIRCMPFVKTTWRTIHFSKVGTRGSRRHVHMLISWFIHITWASSTNGAMD